MSRDVELLPLKSALVNSRDSEEAYYPNNNPPGSSHDYTLLSKRTPASKRYKKRYSNNGNPPGSSHDYTLLSKRTPASKRLQPAKAATPTPMLTLCGAPPPSRRREELTALANLRKKVAPAMMHSDRRSSRNNNEQTDNEPAPLDNRPKLLQKTLAEWSENIIRISIRGSLFLRGETSAAAGQSTQFSLYYHCAKRLAFFTKALTGLLGLHKDEPFFLGRGSTKAETSGAKKRRVEIDQSLQD
ncbi:hypothetical protein MSG28_000004 [Choristoneura fumiferana]|uniref:Uncharacterized protein n=1 Tax=Choristoneura fumiferana TaxID=7141 RepID=A0ACC0JZH6_CHOFU|nr:hypothetical protein MSG28_000004 [Choristoneura fumiferana]